MGEEDEGGDMEGWEDDGWGAMDDTGDQGANSGADFFDTFHSSAASTTRPKAKNEDFFETFSTAATSTSSGSRERSPPPPVSSDLFGGGGYKSGGGVAEESGWGDWGSEFVSEAPSQRVSPTRIQVKPRAHEPLKAVKERISYVIRVVTSKYNVPPRQLKNYQIWNLPRGRSVHVQ